jgi:hypothetical protein
MVSGISPGISGTQEGDVKIILQYYDTICEEELWLILAMRAGVAQLAFRV